MSMLSVVASIALPTTYAMFYKCHSEVLRVNGPGGYRQSRDAVTSRRYPQAAHACIASNRHHGRNQAAVVMASQWTSPIE